MGQRHQFFIRVLNPVKHNTRFNKEERSKLRKLLGNGNYTVLAFHHQWLYGRSAVVNIINLFEKSNLETMNTYNNPFGIVDYSDYDMERWVSDLKSMVNIQTNPLHPRGIGIERTIFLNEDEPEMRDFFNYGDNNDGISIIDTISGKYCMMNINSFDEKEVNGIYSLPEMQPLSGMDYMKAYYPTDIDKLDDYDKKDKTSREVIDMLIENEVENEKVNIELECVSKGVLTLAEIKKIFPRMELGVVNMKRQP